MLFAIKDFEVVHYNVTKGLMASVFIATVAFIICKLLTPLSTEGSLVLGIFLAPASTILWNIFFDEKAKVYSQKSIFKLIDEAKHQREQYIQDFTQHFIKIRGQNLTTAKKRHIETYEEVELLILLVRSSFATIKEIRNDLPRVKVLSRNVLLRGSRLKMKFGIQLQDLFYLYETNCNYYKDFYGLDVSITLKIQPRQIELLKHKRFRDNPPFKDITSISNDLADDPPYAQYYETRKIFVTDADVSIDELHLRSIQKDLYLQFEQIEGLSAYQNLSIYIACDILTLENSINYYRWEQNSHDVFESYSNLGQREMLKVADLIKSNPPIYFLFNSLMDFEFYELNQSSYTISTVYWQELGLIYTQALSRDLDCLDFDSFLKHWQSYQSYLNETPNTYESLSDVLFRAIVKFVQTDETTDCTLELRKLIDDSSFSLAMQRVYVHKLELLNQFFNSERDGRAIVLRKIFAQLFDFFYLKTTRMSLFQPCQQFCKRMSI